jgi:hypothetical protein
MLITRKIIVILMPVTFFIVGIMEFSDYFLYYRINTLISSVVLFLSGLGFALTLFFLRKNNPRFTQWLHADMLHPNDQ